MLCYAMLYKRYANAIISFFRWMDGSNAGILESMLFAKVSKCDGCACKKRNLIVGSGRFCCFCCFCLRRGSRRENCVNTIFTLRIQQINTAAFLSDRRTRASILAVGRVLLPGTSIAGNRFCYHSHYWWARRLIQWPFRHIIRIGSDLRWLIYYNHLWKYLYEFSWWWCNGGRSEAAAVAMEDVQILLVSEGDADLLFFSIFSLSQRMNNHL